MAEIKVDVVVIGSGPAGNTAAIYLSRSNLKVSMISGSSIGGQLTTTTEVENFPGFPKPILGMDLMVNMMEQCRNLGVDIVYDQVSKVDFSQKPYKCTLDSGDVYISNYVIISTGATAKWLGLESERKFMGHGVSACATCDGSFYKGKVVAVVGGGSSAGTEALHLSHLASKVYLIHRKDTFRMADNILNKVKQSSNIECIMDSKVIDIMGTETPKLVNKIKVLNIKTEKETEIDINGIFISIGKAPATGLFKDTDLHLDENGYIITASDSCRTNIPGVYAAGDVVNKPFKQGIIAAGYGAVAALEIQNDMEK